MLDPGRSNLQYHLRRYDNDNCDQVGRSGDNFICYINYFID
jgi:hypothetical protein